MNENNTNQLVLKSVKDLFRFRYFIPSYQRGYRWTGTQVTQLLEDIWQFSKRYGKSKGEFYCLQPIVVKRFDDMLEVIDGQQRLTTIYLVIRYLEDIIKVAFPRFSCFPPEYQTRTDSRMFLADVKTKTKEDAELYIDYFYIWQAYATIKAWFEDEENNVNTIDFINTLLKEEKDKNEVDAANNVRVIWYEIDETESNNSIDIFTRLNIGKIPLTNAELIKALFLQKGNFAEEQATLKQIQIASEWDMIEKTLQNDIFWFFIYNPDNPLKYDNRIEYIFDLMKERTKESEDYHTFNEFFNDFQNIKPDDIWLEIKKYFLTFEEWFNDDELYHYIGYLIDCVRKGKSELRYIDHIIKHITSLKKVSSETTKSEFKEYLMEEIKKQISCKIENLTYDDNGMQIKKVLLLFNIQTILETQKSEMRFPFHKYKSENWDIEHICSRTDKKFNAKERAMWVDDILEYFAGTISDDEVEVFMSECGDDKVADICNRLIKLKRSEQIEEYEFQNVFERLQKHFGEDEQTSTKDDISNLALLDSATNRSFGNSFFPIKRKRIIENDKNGIFVPIATKNLFLKYYSPEAMGNMNWSDNDAKDYLSEIQTTLELFLGSVK